MQSRLDILSNHIVPCEVLNYGRKAQKGDDDIVIIGFARTAMIKAKKGPFKDTALEQMMTPILKAVVDMAGIKSEQVTDVQIGNVLSAGAGVATSRISQYLAGFPDAPATVAINRLCSSGLQAVANVANQIYSGEIDIGIGAGYESMTKNNFDALVNRKALSDDAMNCEAAKNCILGMGVTAENVAQKYGITREQQDQFAMESNNKAEYAQKMGWSQ